MAVSSQTLALQLGQLQAQRDRYAGMPEASFAAGNQGDAYATSAEHKAAVLAEYDRYIEAKRADIASSQAYEQTGEGERGYAEQQYYNEAKARGVSVEAIRDQGSAEEQARYADYRTRVDAKREAVNYSPLSGSDLERAGYVAAYTPVGGGVGYVKPVNQTLLPPNFSTNEGENFYAQPPTLPPKAIKEQAVSLSEPNNFISSPSPSGYAEKPDGSIEFLASFNPFQRVMPPFGQKSGLQTKVPLDMQIGEFAKDPFGKTFGSVPDKFVSGAANYPAQFLVGAFVGAGMAERTAANFPRIKGVEPRPVKGFTLTAKGEIGEAGYRLEPGSKVIFDERPGFQEKISETAKGKQTFPEIVRTESRAPELNAAYKGLGTFEIMGERGPQARGYIIEEGRGTVKPGGEELTYRVVGPEDFVNKQAEVVKSPSNENVFVKNAGSTNELPQGSIKGGGTVELTPERLEIGMQNVERGQNLQGKGNLQARLTQEGNYLFGFEPINPAVDLFSGRFSAREAVSTQTKFGDVSGNLRAGEKEAPFLNNLEQMQRLGGTKGEKFAGKTKSVNFNFEQQLIFDRPLTTRQAKDYLRTDSELYAESLADRKASLRKPTQALNEFFADERGTLFPGSRMEQLLKSQEKPGDFGNRYRQEVALRSKDLLKQLEGEELRARTETRVREKTNEVERLKALETVLSKTKLPAIATYRTKTLTRTTQNFRAPTKTSEVTRTRANTETIARQIFDTKTRTNELTRTNTRTNQIQRQLETTRTTTTTRTPTETIPPFEFPPIIPGGGGGGGLPGLPGIGHYGGWPALGRKSRLPKGKYTPSLVGLISGKTVKKAPGLLFGGETRYAISSKGRKR